MMFNLYSVAAFLLKGIDFVNSAAEPWKPFTRTAEIIDNRPLDEKASILLKQHQENFLVGKGLSWLEKPNSLGDMCIWQGVYTAYTAMHLKNSPGQEAVDIYKDAKEGLWLHHNLFPSCVVVRGVAPKDKAGIDPSKVYKEKEGYLCRDNASLDSFVGFVYGLSHMGESDRTVYALQVVSQLESNGWLLKNFDGSNTTYGDLQPKALQAPVRLLALLALLKMSSKHRGLYEKISSSRKDILACGETHFLSKEAWFNGHMSMLCYDMLLNLENDERFRKPLKQGLERLWNKKKESGNAWLTYVCIKHDIGDSKKYAARAEQVMREYSIPQTKESKMKKNSDRKDIEIVKWGNDLVSTQPLPSWQAPACDYLWQRRPYGLDGQEHLEYAGLDYLIAYEAGRIAGCIK